MGHGSKEHNLLGEFMMILVTCILCYSRESGKHGVRRVWGDVLRAQGSSESKADF